VRHLLSDRLHLQRDESRPPPGAGAGPRLGNHLWRGRTGDRPVQAAFEDQLRRTEQPFGVPLPSQPSWRWSAPRRTGFTGRWMTGCGGPIRPGAFGSIFPGTPCGHPCGSCGLSLDQWRHPVESWCCTTPQSSAPAPPCPSPIVPDLRRPGLPVCTAARAARGGGAYDQGRPPEVEIAHSAACSIGSAR